MKNQATWELANSYAGKLLLLSGVTMLPFSIRAFVYETHELLVPGALGVLQVVSAASILVLIIIFTEMALRKEFDKNGERKR